MLRKIVVLALLASLPAQIVHAQASKAFSGHVFDAQTKRGIENLEVKLRPPSSSTAPILIGTTDQNGVFRFSQVRIGVYLVEVSQGPYLLYRGEVDISKLDRIEIPVQRR
jgi:5-hydroxyisourate hydrolase-like protein (transthyretin family)